MQEPGERLRSITSPWSERMQERAARGMDERLRLITSQLMDVYLDD
jgi:hypothetical protein